MISNDLEQPFKVTKTRNFTVPYVPQLWTLETRKVLTIFKGHWRSPAYTTVY